MVYAITYYTCYINALFGIVFSSIINMYVKLSWKFGKNVRKLMRQSMQQMKDMWSRIKQTRLKLICISYCFYFSHWNFHIRNWICQVGSEFYLLKIKMPIWVWISSLLIYILKLQMTNLGVNIQFETENDQFGSESLVVLHFETDNGQICSCFAFLKLRIIKSAVVLHFETDNLITGVNVLHIDTSTRFE